MARAAPRRRWTGSAESRAAAAAGRSTARRSERRGGTDRAPRFFGSHAAGIANTPCLSLSEAAADLTRRPSPQPSAEARAANSDACQMRNRRSQPRPAETASNRHPDARTAHATADRSDWHHEQPAAQPPRGVPHLRQPSPTTTEPTGASADRARSPHAGIAAAAQAADAGDAAAACHPRLTGARPPASARPADQSAAAACEPSPPTSPPRSGTEPRSTAPPPSQPPPTP